jgi:hypothetical protein
MELLKLDGLDTPIRVETYAFFARAADALLHKKLFANGRLPHRDIALIARARQEYRRAQRLLSTYKVMPHKTSDEPQNSFEKTDHSQVVQNAIELRESAKFNLYEEAAQAIR